VRGSIPSLTLWIWLGSTTAARSNRGDPSPSAARCASFDAWPVIVTDPRNPAGKGFDPLPQGRALGEFLRWPAGYPVVEGERELPNVEAPDRLIRRPDAAPDPASWATLPLSSVTHATHRAHVHLRRVEEVEKGVRIRVEHA